jgi:archaellum biogenesis protein FlaJ (TadC family)
MGRGGASGRKKMAEKKRYRGKGKTGEYMDARILDVLTGAASLLVFIVLLIALPGLMPGNTGIAYIVALVLFLVTMSGAGYVINEKIS